MTLQNFAKSLMLLDPNLVVLTSCEVNPWIEFILKIPLYVDNIDILHIPSNSIFVYNFTNNGAEFQYLDGNTWKTIFTFDSDFDTSLNPSKFKVQKKSKKFIIAYTNGKNNFIGLTYKI